MHLLPHAGNRKKLRRSRIRETPRVTFLAKQTKEYDEAQKPALALCTVYAESAGNQNVASVLEPITVEITNKGTQTGKFSESLTSIPPLGEEKSEKVKVKTKFTLPELAAGVEDPVTWTPSELGTTSAVVTGTTSQGAIAAASTVAIGTEAATGTVEKITDSTKEEAATCKTPTVGTATVTMKESKSASDGLSAGEIITIEKATKAGYNATSVEIKTTPTINTFTYCIAKAAETEEKTGPTVKVLATIVVSGTTATAHVTAAPATAFAAKEKVNIAGVKGGEAEYNDKTVEILSAPTTTSFTFAVKSGTANGLNGTVGLPGTGAAENGGVATINLATEPASALSAGQEIEIGSVTVTTYNGTFKIKEVLSAKSFTYEDAAAKEAVASGAGELTSAVAPCKYSVPGYILKAENAGKCKIEAKQAGNESYGPGSATLELTISGGAQTIAWSPEGGNISSKTPTEITATTNSGISPGKITSTTEATCTVGASTEPVAGTAKVTVTPVAEGKCTLSASGNGGTPNWAELKATTKEFTVSNAGVTQTISFTEPTPATLVHSPVTLVATASSKLAVSFTSTTPSVCTTGGAHGEEVTLVAEGFCKITAEQAGQEGVYAAAKAVTEEFRVAKADQVLIFDSSDFSSVAYGTADFAIKGTSKAAASENAYNSEEQAEGEPTGLQPTYEAVGACTVNSEGTDVHITGTGVCAITASQAGNSLYREAPQVGIEFEVTKAASTITFANPGKQTANEPAFSPGATASSGAPVSYTAEGHCSITGAEEVKVTTAGTCTVTAHSVGTENYSPPARVSQSFEVVASTFTIEKLQKLAGEPTYSKSKITGAEIGAIVDYEVIVKNTNAGNVPLEFQPLSDAGCVSISPSGAETVAAGGQQAYTCEHMLTAAGSYANTASIEGNEGTGVETSNTVEAEVPTKASFTIEGEQKLEGEASYTKLKITGAEIGETVDYKILVKDTGNVPLTFKALSDGHCTGIAPAGEETVARGGEETYTCSHVLTATGAYRNTPSITGNEGTGTKSATPVEVEVPANPKFTIEAEQKLEGEASYTKSKITGGEVGKTVDYKIVVKNTGNVSLKFKALSDTGCTGVAPTGEETLARGGEETYTCSHELTATGVYTNSASIEGNEGTGNKTSNTVEAEVASAPSFTIEKEQKLEGEAAYTKSKLSGAEVGATVDYRIVVKNTGNEILTFKALSDPTCTGIAPAGEETVARGGEETYACSHELTAAGVYTNSASIEGNFGTGTKTSNTVEAEVPTKASFTIEKLQKLEGEASYTKSKLTGAEVGQTVDYQIVVKDSGNVPLTFKALSDSGCAGIAPAGEETVARGGEETYTCSHELTSAGVYANSASIEGNESAGTKTSNSVEAEVPSAPSFTIEKQQKLESEPTYTKSKLTGAIGNTVDYKIVVKNTGNISLTFKALSDAKCTGIAPAGEETVARGGEESYTCSHELTSTGVYTNSASIEGDESAGSKTSNLVEAEVPAKPGFTIEKEQKLAGEAGYTKSKLANAEIGETVDYKILVKNTGNTPLRFKALSDPKCTGIAPAGEESVARGGEETYTCSHELTGVGVYTNSASIEDKTASKTSNTVEAEVPPAPSFTVEKLQKVGAGSYTASELTGAIGDTVDYEVIVKNTGNTTLTFDALKDAGCEGVAGGATELASGASTTFTCSHKLTAAGPYSNQASIEGNEGTGTEDSNTVTANVPSEPSFTVEKLQKVGADSYTKFELTGAIGQTVDYEVIVKNTGNTTLTFGALKDAGCEGVAGGATELASGASTTFTCSHKLTAAGPYSNQASIEGNEGTGTEDSNTVTANVPSEPSFTVEKLQKIGAGSYTTSEVTGAIGDTVDYEVIVKNTGNTTLTFGALSDGGCEGVTGGASELASGEAATFTCSHKLTGTGKYSNAASITGNEGTGSETSNTVVANVPSEPAFTIEKEQKLSGEGTYTKFELTGAIGQTVDYEVIVKNTGNTTLTFGALSDGGCEGVTGGASELASGEAATFTCSHKLTGTGKYSNAASITGNEGTGSETSNTVITNVASEPAFTIAAQQKISGEASYTTSELTAKVGQTVDYEVVVQNTGNTTLKFGALSDGGCEGTSGGASELASGASATFTCSHALTGAGKYSNAASITGNEGTGAETSNTVTVSVAAAEASPHWYGDGNALAEGRSASVKLHGSITLHADGSAIMCKLAGVETIENPVGGGAGTGKVTSLNLTGCKATPTVCAVKEAVAVKASLPLSGELADAAPIRDELEGVELKVYCGASEVRDTLTGTLAPEVGSSDLVFASGSGELAESVGSHKATVTGRVTLTGPKKTKKITAKAP